MTSLTMFQGDIPSDGQEQFNDSQCFLML